ncbi:hypothetical protein T02_9246 [Trichinella nativa]|uniref:Uncharacterized protein n=1 Tax=Trichinella nativa TaxID=6335 RepID=A0A0V1LA22_9BILA|nr:hypothetical protein T02_9246 [Trichinella nativa]
MQKAVSRCKLSTIWDITGHIHFGSSNCIQNNFYKLNGKAGSSLKLFCAFEVRIQIYTIFELRRGKFSFSLHDLD